MTVATLNYDLTIETAAAQQGVEYSLGLDDWAAGGEVGFGSHGIRLNKLHGSIDWRRVEWRPDCTGEQFGVARSVVTFGADGPMHSTDVPFLVFGRREKLRPEGPSLELLGDFRARLHAARALVVVGYSFADRHINELISRWASSESNRLLVIVDPFFPREARIIRLHPENFRRRLVRGLRDSPRNDFTTWTKSRLVVVRKSAKDVLADLCVADYEQLLAMAVATTPSP